MIDLLDISEQAEGCGTEKKYRLADYFNRWWDEYAQHPAEYITPNNTRRQTPSVYAIPPLWG